MEQYAQPDRTLLQSAWSKVPSTMMVECEQFIYVYLCDYMKRGM